MRAYHGLDLRNGIKMAKTELTEAETRSQSICLAFEKAGWLSGTRIREESTFINVGSIHTHPLASLEGKP